MALESPLRHHLSKPHYPPGGLTFRRGRCFAEMDRIMTFPLPVAGKGVFARPTAAAANFSTSGRVSPFAESRRMKRFWFPEPSSSLLGSGRRAPQYGNESPTPFAP